MNKLNRKENKKKTNKPKVKLIGTDGNAYAILGACVSAAEKSEWSEEEIDTFLGEAKSGNYDHLLSTCMKYFEVR